MSCIHKRVIAIKVMFTKTIEIKGNLLAAKMISLTKTTNRLTKLKQNKSNPLKSKTPLNDCFYTVCFCFYAKTIGD